MLRELKRLPFITLIRPKLAARAWSSSAVRVHARSLCSPSPIVHPTIMRCAPLLSNKLTTMYSGLYHLPLPSPISIFGEMSCGSPSGMYAPPTSSAALGKYLGWYTHASGFSGSEWSRYHLSSCLRTTNVSYSSHSVNLLLHTSGVTVSSTTSLDVFVPATTDASILTSLTESTQKKR